MVASYFGHKVSLHELRQRYATGLRGSSLKTLTQMACSLQLMPRSLRLALAELRQLQLPCVLHWDLDHFVVLERVAARSIRIVDPAIGRRRISRGEAGKHFSGVALELIPAKNFRKQKGQPGLRMIDLVAGSKGLLRSLSIVLALSLALQTLALVLPFYSQLVIDDVILRNDRNLLQLLGFVFLLLVIMQAILIMFRAWVVVSASTRLGISWSARVFRHLLRLPLDFFDRRNLGDVQSRFGSVASLQQLITRQVVETLVDGLMAITTLLVMLAYDPLLSMIVVSSVFLYLSVRLAFYAPMHEASTKALATAAAREGVFLESLRGMLSIKATGIEQQRESVFLDRLVKASNAKVGVNRWGIWQVGINSGVFGMQLVVVIWLGAAAVLDQRLTVGMLVAFLAYRALFTERAAALVDKLFEFRLARVELDRLGDIVKTRVEPGHAGKRPGLATREPLRIEATELQFRYSKNAPTLLHRATLTILPGEHVVLTGTSGAGKTTLVKLLMGLLLPSSGSITVNGVPMSQYGILRYRRQISAVMQDDHLFSGSLLDNISLFDPQPDIEHCRRCAWVANIDQTIESLPMQYFSQAGDMGAALSGGQRQRLLLARALYARPEVLFLDEFTSHLDAECEKTVNERLSRLSMTRVVVAHRERTIRNAEREIRIETAATLAGPTGRA